MFGSILAMSKEDVRFAAILSVIVLGLFLFCYNKIFAVTFDENFARATGVNVSIYNVLASPTRPLRKSMMPIVLSIKAV